MKPTLLILAAGMGSRYGGLKQIDPVGPNGETIIDYSVFDALRAGFGKIVFVIRRDIEGPFKEMVGARFEKRVPVEYAFQELTDLPAGFSVPAGRTKPWGTTHAILMAEKAIEGPFAAINADDFYGADSFRTLADHLNSGSSENAMIGFVLRNTLSDFGSVARGVCQISPQGLLTGVTEYTGIVPSGHGAAALIDGGKSVSLTGEELVSMNMWGFKPELFGHLKSEFVKFLSARGHEEKSECYIPTAVNDLISAGHAQVKVLRTNSAWFGVTYRDDRPFVVSGIRKLIEAGDYPQHLTT